MNGIQVKVLSSQDVDVLLNVDGDVFDHEVRPEYARRFLDGPNNVLAVALQDGLVVGMASALVYDHPDKPLQLFVNEVGVASRCHRQGIGKALVEAVLQEGRARGCAEAWVATEENNVAARALYESLRGREDEDRAVVYTWSLPGRGHADGA